MNQNLRFTQNFLHSEPLVAKIVEQAAIKEGDTVLEIGPGKGIITRELAKKVGPSGKVVAVELDTALVQELQPLFAHTPQVEILHQDILTFDLQRMGEEYSVFSNVPFAISAKILERLFTPTGGLKAAHLILQLDTLLDSRFARKPVPTFKSLLIFPLYEVTIAHRFSRSDFTPRPSVETALFAFQRRSNPLISENLYQTYKDFLAFVSRDRVGEGSWLQLFPKKELKLLAGQSKLQWGKGLKSQPAEALVQFFHAGLISRPEAMRRVHGAFQKLRAEQDRTARINEEKGHHASRARRP